MEDFYPVQGEAIVVSTIHKAKGKEFDNVFLLLTNIESLSDEKKREVYVAITRAKQNLSIHTNGHYLSNIANGLAEYRINSNTYPAPQSLCYTLTHRDLWLDFFIDSHCQAAINTLKAVCLYDLQRKDAQILQIMRFYVSLKSLKIYSTN